MEIVEHPNCPACGKGTGEMRKANAAKLERQLKDKTKPLKFYPVAEVGVHVSLDMMNPPIVGGRIPAIRSYKDICEECGAIWSVKTERGHVTYTGDPRQPVKDFR